MESNWIYRTRWIVKKRPELQTEQLFVFQTVNNEIQEKQIVHHAVVLICEVDVFNNVHQDKCLKVWK